MSPDLQSLIGRRIYRAWVLPYGKTLVLKLEGGKIVIVDAVRTDIPDTPLAVVFEQGDETAGAHWDDLDRVAPQTPHTREIRGKKVTGLDGNVLMFDDRYGAEITVDAVRWVKVAE